VADVDELTPKVRQRERAAEQARQKQEERREKQSGAAGWVAERASEYSLQGPDYRFMERSKYLWNPLMDYWFRMEIEGWEKIPPGPVLLIGIHSGAPFVWDAWTVGVQWWRHFGESRPLLGTAHDALMAAPGVGSLFRKMGVIPAHADSITAALAAGQLIAVIVPWRALATTEIEAGRLRMAVLAHDPDGSRLVFADADSEPGRAAADLITHLDSMSLSE